MVIPQVIAVVRVFAVGLSLVIALWAGMAASARQVCAGDSSESTAQPTAAWMTAVTAMDHALKPPTDQPNSLAPSALDWPRAASAAAAIEHAWSGFERAVERHDRVQYAAVEIALGDLMYAVSAEAHDREMARTALKKINHLLLPQSPGATASAYVAPVSVTAHGAGQRPAPTTLSEARVEIQWALAAVARGATAAASQAMSGVRRNWPMMEGAVRVTAPAQYHAIEDLLPSIDHQLRRDRVPLADMRRLHELMHVPAAASWIDALILVFREGLEAMLVVIALLMWQRKAGAAGRPDMVWLGVGAGVVLSVALAVILHWVVAAATAAHSREVIEGAVGLIAAALLIGIGWWLHQHARAGSTIAARLSTAGAWTLAGISLLAVAREGAETALFLAALPGVSAAGIAAGAGLAGLALAVLGGVVVIGGVRLPTRQVFFVLSLFMLYLAVRFAGSGMHALAVAGWFDAGRGLGPALPWLGWYPTWPSLSAQAVVIAIVIALLWLRARAPAKAKATANAETTASAAAI